MNDNIKDEDIIRLQATSNEPMSSDVIIRVLARLLDKRDRELYFWRGLLGIVIFIAIVTNLITFYSDKNQHMRDNIERAMHWQKIEDGIETNRRSLVIFDEHLRACTNCHSHGEHEILLKNWAH